MIWLGDFNWHHPLWDKECNSHLFTTNNLDAAQILLDLLTDYDMIMALPKNIPTLHTTHSKNLIRLDNIFCSSEIRTLVTQCLTHPNLQPPCTDHFPISCKLDTAMAQSPISPRLNWQQVDWDKFCQHLTQQLATHQPPSEITTFEEFSDRLTDLTTAINTTVAATVPFNTPSPYTKRWWTKELSQAHFAMRHTARSANKVNNDPKHPSH